MSCYVVNDETISVIARAFAKYEVCYYYNDEKSYTGMSSMIAHYQKSPETIKIGQTLLEQNYKSVNENYNEDTPTRAFDLKDIKINEGMIFGCIQNYMYQACETKDWSNSPIYMSLNNLKDAILESMLKQQGQEIPWGID